VTEPLSVDPESALPSVRARALAFASIIVCAALGGAIGYWFGDLSGNGTVASGFLMLTGTLVFALGGAVVSVLSLRALAEWTSSAAARGDEPTPVEQLLDRRR
jgi:ABC-type xylose transport system permease subunit